MSAPLHARHNGQSTTVPHAAAAEVERHVRHL